MIVRGVECKVYATEETKVTLLLLVVFGCKHDQHLNH